MKLWNSIKLISIAFVLWAVGDYLNAQQQGHTTGGRDSDAGQGQGWRAYRYEPAKSGSSGGHKKSSHRNEEPSPTRPPHKPTPKPSPTPSAKPSPTPSATPKRKSH